MMRQLTITRDTAVKARPTAMHTLKQIVVHASPVLRAALHDLTDHGLLTRGARLRPGPLDTPTASAKQTLRALARRWRALTEEMAIHDQHLASARRGLVIGHVAGYRRVPPPPCLKSAVWRTAAGERTARVLAGVPADRRRAGTRTSAAVRDVGPRGRGGLGWRRS